jgi:hypothetical protein
MGRRPRFSEIMRLPILWELSGRGDGPAVLALGLVAVLPPAPPHGICPASAPDSPLGVLRAGKFARGAPFHTAGSGPGEVSRESAAVA